MLLLGGKGYQKDASQDVFTRAKMSLAKKGRSIKPQSKQHYEMMSKLQTGKTRPQIKCPFCGKVGGDGNMQRWHFAKCKLAPIPTKKINGYDCDGVITIGIYPGPSDVIITGRSYEESVETLDFLKGRGIHNQVYFSPHEFEKKTRALSGTHKGNTIWKLFQEGTVIQVFFEDDWDQYNLIRKAIIRYSLPTKLVWVNHMGLIELENKRHHENHPKL